ncbi:MAG: hypothetical protein MUO54_12935 [Anaerolineales bacterium]|nr:hypothetical protein [Anaerolineales bacterium]
MAHGLLGLSVISGLAARLGFSEGTAIALREIEWKFKTPIKIGDTIKALFVVKDKMSLRNQEGGLINFRVKVTNQQEELVQVGNWKMIIQRKPI